MSSCIFCRCLAWLQAWLQNRRMARAQLEAAQAQQKADQARDAALAERKRRDRSVSFHRRRDEPPPTPLPPPEDAENLKTLRARIFPRSKIVNDEEVFTPPWPTDTVEEACRVAADHVSYYIQFAIAEDDRELVASRTVQAIATAVSTSPSPAVFVAALTMAESLALIYSENPFRSRHHTRLPPGIVARRRLNALNAAVEAGMAVHTEEVAHPEDKSQWSDDDEISIPDSQTSIVTHTDLVPLINNAHATVQDPASPSILRQGSASRPETPSRSSQ